MKRVLWIATVMVCSSLWADAQGLTIADMARRERAKRQAAEKQAAQKPQKAQKPAKSAPVTNSRLELTRPAPEQPEPSLEGSAPAETEPATAAVTMPSSPATIAPPPPAAVAAPAAPEAPASKEPVRDEKWWRERFDKARADVRRAENQVAVAELEFNAANREFLTNSFDPDGRGPAAIAASKKKWDDAKKRLDEARAKLIQLEEELRQAGAPAGWAR